MPRVSVIVPVHYGGQAFERCLAALQACDPAPDELIVVADGVTDGAWRAAEAAPGVRCVVHDPARGPAAARNRGAELATGEVLFFVDADVVVPPTIIADVKATFEADAALDALIGSYDAEPGDAHFLSQYRNLLHHYTHQRAQEEATTFWGACGAVRRAAFQAVGGFDAEAYRLPSIEDIDLGYRLTAAGFRIRLLGEIQVKHLKRWDAATMVRTDVLQRSVPWTRLMLERGALEQDLNVQASQRLSVLAAWGGLGSIILAPWMPSVLLLTLACAALLIGLNAPFYRFLKERRGVGFMARAVPWHAFYFLYAGLGFGLGVLAYGLSVWRSPDRPSTAGAAPAARSGDGAPQRTAA